MTKLSRHFSRSEFACKCGCGFATVDAELLKTLEVVREYFDEPVTINSGCRCDEHNRNERAALGLPDNNSKHKQGIAADIVVKNVSPIFVYDFLFEYMPNKFGMKAYDNFTHIDVRQSKWRG